MSTITAILEPQADGTVHVPVPSEMLGARIRVEATLRPVAEAHSESVSQISDIDTRTFEEVFGADWNTRESNGEAMGAALERLAKSDISTRIDLDEWVREIRNDKPLAGRE